jgi:hypothetical protein
MDDDDSDNHASPQYQEYVSAYEQAASDHDWLSELSEEWISNGGSSEPSEQGSARGMSVRAAFGITPGKIDTIPEETEEVLGTVRIVLAETDVQNTPEWKRRLDEAKSTPKDLFSPCHLENLFNEDTTRYIILFPFSDFSSSKSASQPVSPNYTKQTTLKDRPLTNTASFLKDITESVSVKSSKSVQQSPLRQVFTSEDASSPPNHDNRPTTGSTTSSGKSTMRSFDEKSTHESSDEDLSLEDLSLEDPNEDLSIAEPTQTLMDPLSFYTARQDEISARTPPDSSADESFRTANVARTPHPNASSSLASSTEAKSRSVRFAQEHEEHSFAFDFTPQLPIESPSVDVERPSTPQQNSSAKNTPHQSPLKLFDQYDTFTHDKMSNLINHLLPADEEDSDFRHSREFKRARREAMSRDRIPRLPQNQEIRHNRVASLTTQEMVDDAEDFMRDLRSMPRPTSIETLRDSFEDVVEEENAAVEEDEEELNVENLNEEGVDEEEQHEEEDFGASTIDEGNVSSEFEEHPCSYVDYDEHSESESEAYDSIRHVQSPGKLLLSPGKAAQLAQIPSVNANPASRVSSAESMQVIHPDDVAHILPTTVGSMTFDAEKKAWFRVRTSQMGRRPSEGDDSMEVDEQVQDEEEYDIFGDIDDLVLTDEEEPSNFGSRPSSSGEFESEGNQLSEQKDNSYESEDGSRMSSGEKERGSAQEYPEEKSHQPEEETGPTNVFEVQQSPIAPPKSPLRKSVSCSPLPSPISASPAKSQRSFPPSPLRQPLQVSTQQINAPLKASLGSPIRSPHRKTPSTDKRMRKSLPLPPLDTPEDKRRTAEVKISTPSPSPKQNQNPRRSQYAHLMATPLPTRSIQTQSPFLEPKDSLRLSISPPPADISFANSPRQDISFSVTTKVLVKYLTDFEPFEPYWEKLPYIDFHGKNVTSLDGLKSFCPKLQELDIKDCKVKYLTGLPSTVRILKASGNRFNGLVSFAWGKNIQYLDLANNEIDCLAGRTSYREVSNL